MKQENIFSRIIFAMVCWIVHIILDVADYCIGIYDQIKFRR
jgi:hypothetical protein